MSHLDKVGIPGSDHLREALTNCTDPLQAIEEFQTQNGILLPSLRPALPFLDLHGVQRLEFHQTSMEELRDALLNRISELAESGDKNKQKILTELLTRSFPVIKMKALRPVVLEVMKHVPKIKAEYLLAVVENQDVYKEAAVEVKQQIWQDNQALFGDEVSPLLSRYIEEKDTTLLDRTNLHQPFFGLSPKQRRQADLVQQLSKMVGRNVKLYDMMLQFLRTLFLRTRNVYYCTLRAELLMALHDVEVHEICSVDPCHKFTWCLDACVRERFMDSKRAKELQGFLDGIRRSHIQVLGDLSMILCDPYAINTIAQSTIRILQHCLNTETVPRQSDDLVFMLRLLALGLGAWHMIDSSNFKEGKLDVNLVTRVMPAIVSLMADDQMSLIANKLPDEAAFKADSVPPALISYVRDNPVAATVTVYYALQVARQKDVNAICRILPALAQSDSDVVFQHTILHTLVGSLSNMADQFVNLDLIGAVFDQFLLPNLSRDNVISHTLRLLWWVHHKVAPVRLESLLKMVAPNEQHGAPTMAAYKALMERIDSHQPSPTHEPEKLDSPLMSVPAPTPAHI